VCSIARQDCSLPGIGHSRVRLGLNLGELKRMKQIGNRVVRESHIGRRENLINHGSPEKVSKLLLFDGIARSGEDMAFAGEHCAGNSAADRGEKSEVAFVEEKLPVAAAQLDSIRGLNLVGGG